MAIGGNMGGVDNGSNTYRLNGVGSGQVDMQTLLCNSINHSIKEFMRTTSLR